MKALLVYIPPNQAEGDSIGELQFHEVEVDWSNVTPDEVKRLQNQFREISLPNGEKLQVKAQNESGGFIVLARQDGQFLAQVTGRGDGFLAFRTLAGAIVGMSIIENSSEGHA